MGCRIVYDSEQELAVMYCSTSDMAFGPVFYAENDHDANERVEAFTRWLVTDPRVLDDLDLISKYLEWRAQEITQFANEEAALFADDE